MDSTIDPEAKLWKIDQSNKKRKFSGEGSNKNCDSQKSSMASASTAIKWYINLRIIVSQRTFRKNMLTFISQKLMKYQIVLQIPLCSHFRMQHGV